MVHWWVLVHCGWAAEFEHMLLMAHHVQTLAINPNISMLVLWHKQQFQKQHLKQF
jgi:glycerol uptake facilitator-like aquaporin